MAVLPKRPFPLGARSLVLLCILLAGVVAANYLGLNLASLSPAPDARGLISEVFGSAVTPAVTYESSDLPPDIDPLMVRVGGAVLRTLAYAVGAMSLALILGLVLGFFSSTAWWANDPVALSTPKKQTYRSIQRLPRWAIRTIESAIHFLRVLPGFVRRYARVATYSFARILIAIMRSTHELLWAILFMAAMGLTPLAAVIALTLPHAGILAKIFAEMVDEAPRDSAHHLRNIGANALQAYFFGLVPRARNDLVAYSFYRFECIVRGSAVLGFFGIETIGRYVREAFDNRHYHEMWTYIYALLVVVVLLDLWSGLIRRRMA